MPTSTIYPARLGLSVPRGENLQATEIFSEGGLDLTQSIIENRPGCASILTNFEVSLTGGYRRINGFQKFNSAIVPGEGQVLNASVFFPSSILASRKDLGTATYSLYQSSWIKLNTSALNYVSGMSIYTDQWNWTGTYKIVHTDGVNHAYTWDGLNYVILNAAGSPANPQYCKIFHGYLFLAGYSANTGAVSISAPLAETDWTPADGAAEIVIGDTITGFATWRDQLIVFCAKSIKKIVGNSTDPASSTPFTVQEITSKIGCPSGKSIQEINGDIVFLSPDGIRTISGTFNIGDTEIASISRPIQNIVANINTINSNIHSLVIDKKTQYRLFYPTVNIDETKAKGIVGGIRRFRDGHEAWEWGELQGIRPSCCAHGYLADNIEYILHGGMDGYLYRQEIGSSFNGAAINEDYLSVPLELGDGGLRKHIQRVTLYFASEGNAANTELQIVYNYNNPNTPQPANVFFNLADNSTALVFNSGIRFNTGNVYGTKLPIQHRTLVQGSGFIIQLGITSSFINNAPYIIQGFYIEYYPGSRR